MTCQFHVRHQDSINITKILLGGPEVWSRLSPEKFGLKPDQIGEMLLLQMLHPEAEMFSQNYIDACAEAGRQLIESAAKDWREWAATHRPDQLETVGSMIERMTGSAAE